jgi:prevent-host-death family protein
LLKKYTIAEARDHFAALVHKVEQGTSIELTRRGKPVAVLLSVKEYERLKSEKIGFWDAFIAFQNRVDLQKLDIQPEIFSDVRDSSTGREVAL